MNLFCGYAIVSFALATTGNANIQKKNTTHEHTEIWRTTSQLGKWSQSERHVNAALLPLYVMFGA